MRNSAGPGTLGILVPTDRYLPQLIGLVRAAGKKGVAVLVFFTGPGVLLTQDPRFGELDGLAEMYACKVSMESYGLDLSRTIPGLPAENIASQSKHADLIYYADRFIVL